MENYFIKSLPSVPNMNLPVIVTQELVPIDRNVEINTISDNVKEDVDNFISITYNEYYGIDVSREGELKLPELAESVLIKKWNEYVEKLTPSRKKLYRGKNLEKKLKNFSTVDSTVKLHVERMLSKVPNVKNLPSKIKNNIIDSVSKNYGRIELSYKLYDVLEKRGGQKIDINELHKIDTKKITTKKGDVSYVSSIKKN